MFTIKEKEVLEKYGFKYNSSNNHFEGGLSAPYITERSVSYFVTKTSKDTFEVEELYLTQVESYDDDDEIIPEYIDKSCYRVFNLVELEEYFKEIIAEY